jgi:peptide/nickel transport system permease protein
MKTALRFLARRFVWAIILVLGVTSLSFLVVEVLPGDPARMLLGPQASAADVKRARAIYGLDHGVSVQFVRYWAHLIHRGPPPTPKDKDHRSCAALAFGVHLDLGYSFYYRKPVVDLLIAKIPRSIELALAALLVQLTLGVSLGIGAAAKRGTAWDDAAMSASLLGASAPTFLIGLMLQYLFAYKLGLLPFDGYGATGADHLRSLVLPALTLGLFGSALYARLTREEVAAALGQDFARAARARGASGARVLVVHALRNALGPLSTMIALDLGTMVSGAVVTERIFRWPGVGQLAVDAVLNRDGPVIFGTVLFSAAAVVVATFTLDIVDVLLDPRLRSR